MSFSKKLTGIKISLLVGAIFTLAALTLQATQIKTLSYGPDDTHVMDLYTPDTLPGRKIPAIVLAHGGLWQSGGRASLATLCKNIVAKSGNRIACASIDYRLSQDIGGECNGTGIDTYREQVRDMVQAYSLLQENAAVHGIDPAQMFVGGHSAGGHLAQVLNLRWSEFAQKCKTPEDCPAPRGAIGLEGIYSIPAWNDYDVNFWEGRFACATRKAFGSPGPTPPASMDAGLQQRAWDAGSPTWLANHPEILAAKPAGDVLLIHSTGDDWVDSAEAGTLGDALLKSFPQIKVSVKTDGSCAVGQHNDMLEEPELADCISRFVMDNSSQ